LTTYGQDPVPRESVCFPVTAPVWLTQNDDGTWGHDPGARGDSVSTGLVLLALLGEGETHQSGQFKESIKRALRRLRESQAADGGLDVALRDHSVVALSLIEAYGMTRSAQFRQPSQRALDHSMARARATPLDVETAAWLLLTWKSATFAELDVDSTFGAALRDGLLRRDGGLVIDDGDELLHAAAAALAIAFTAESGDAARAAARVDASAAFEPVLAALRSGHRPDCEPYRYIAMLAADHIDGAAWEELDRVLAPAIESEVTTDGPGRFLARARGGVAAGVVSATALNVMEYGIRRRRLSPHRSHSLQ
jgi:hypothetical protein